MLGNTNLGIVLAHELGHTANAIDPDNQYKCNDGIIDGDHHKDKSNLMYPFTKTNKTLNHKQLSNIKKAITSANPCKYVYSPPKPAFPNSPTSGTTARDNTAQCTVLEKNRIDSPNDSYHSSNSNYVPKSKPKK